MDAYGDYTHEDGTAESIRRNPTLEGAYWHWQAMRVQFVRGERSPKEYQASKAAWKLRDKAAKKA